MANIALISKFEYDNLAFCKTNCKIMLNLSLK